MSPSERSSTVTVDVSAAVAVCAWLIVYTRRALIGHFSLGTNAFDLSLFDYALWSLNRGGHGFVPFIGHSIFSEHFMPGLYLLAPLHRLFPSPVMLLLLQLAATAGAALLFQRITRKHGLDPWLAAGLTLTFLLSRRTHSAVAGYFYPEVFQATLAFAVVLLWSARARVLWPCVVALLATKEDAAIYVAAFAVFAFVSSLGSRKRASVALVVSVVWLVLALAVAIPASRAAEGLGTSNPLLEARYGFSNGGPSWRLLADRLLSRRTAGTLANLVVSAGFLPLAGPSWMVPAAPGVALNLVAAPGSMQSTLLDHYAWPILPWVFLSASAGAAWLSRRSRKLARAWVAVLLLATVADNPAIQRLTSTRPSPEARLVREQLARVTGRTVLAQPNLIPHMPKAMNVFAVGGDFRPVAEPDLVLLTRVGNLWPLTSSEVDSLVAGYRADPRYSEIESGPLYAFRRNR